MKTMSEEIKIPVFIPDAEAAKFLLFQQYFDKISLLIDSGVLDQRGATILLDFDRQGKLKSIRRNDYLYTDR